MSALAAFLDRARARTLTAMDMANAVQLIRASVGPAGVKLLYDTWLEHNPEDQLLYAVLFNYAVALTDFGDLAGAKTLLDRAIELKPDFMPPYINLGRIYERLGAADIAVKHWSVVTKNLAAVNAMAVNQKVTALNQTARVLENRHQDEPAEAMLRQSIELDREQMEAMQHYLALRQRQCKWPVILPWDKQTREVQTAALSPLSAAVHTDDPMLQLAIAWRYNKKEVPVSMSDLVSGHWAAREDSGSGRLRIGYLSSDLRGHAVGYLTAEIFDLHDKGKVELFAYYCGPEMKDALQERVKSQVDHWVSITGMDDATAARRIADDGIQILVDLNGYTKDGRTKLVALRPAPVIVNWLGYPGSMASPYHHYLIADEWIIPPDSEIYYTEKVLRLPCYQPTDRQRTVSEKRPTRAEAGLPEDAMVYCCFNGAHKISRFTFERWLTILSRVPGSVLWLLSSVETTEQRLKEFAKSKGIDPDRIIFASKMANPEHLARYPLADLFLDTAPYGAHTTASDALWMGVPLLTMSGRSFASRVCGSLVRSAGLPDLDCASPTEFVDRAVAMGRDRSIALGYRERLATVRETSVLFDTPKLVARLEELYREMWDDFRADRLPVPDLANLETYLEVGSAVDHEETEIQAIKDYKGWWREKLAAYHALRPIPYDRRLWKKKRG
jgi:predicted O-linked N-acetylglucosamine transferase (SPINDLY family)